MNCTRDLHDQRGIALKEFRPGKVSPAGRQLPEEVPNGVLPRIFLCQATVCSRRCDGHW